MLSESFYLPSSYNEALQLGTYIQEDISLSTVNDVYSPNSPEGAINFLDLPLNRSHYSGMPYLNLIVQPAEMYRFRYESEKGSHGSLGGKGITNSKKSCPTVKLENYENKRNVLIRVSLYTKEEIPRPHVLQLKKKNSVTDDAVYEKLGKDFTAKFQSLCIVNKRKEEIVEILKNRKLKELYPRGSETRKLDKKYEREIEEVAKSMQGYLNAVKLCFEAFYEDDLSTPICEKIFSDPVYNQKSSVAGELKIHRLSRVSGSCQGGDEVILLCDRVRKEDIRVKFFEVDEHYNEVWTDQGTFNLADVHYQVAITFKTPPYQSNVEKDVKIQLYRITDGAVSEPRDFKYLPDEEDFASVAKKRKKPNPSHNFPASTQISVPGNMIDKKYEHLSSDGNAEAPSALSANSLIEPGNEAMQESYSMRQNGEDIGLHSQNEEDLNKNVTELLAEFLPKLSEDLVDNDVTFFDPTYFDDLNIDNTDSNLHMDGAVAKVASLSLNDNSRKVVNWKPESTHKCLRELIACILQTGDVNSLLRSVQNIIPLQDDHGNSLLHIAVSCQNVNLKIIQHLLNVISEDVVNLKNKCKETALHLAVKLNKEKVLKLLLQKGGDPNIPNQDGNNCLHIAAKSDFVLCMKELLHATKCSYFHALNAHNYEGLAPLHVAVMNESLKCVDLLLQAGANVNIIEKKGGQTPLHMAVQTQISVIQLLLKKPEIDVNAEDFRGITPLQLAYVKVNGVEDEGCVDTIIKYPAEDLYRGLEILKVLRKQINEELMKTEDNKNVIERSQSVDSCKEKELCCLLDTNLKWRKLGEVLGMDEGGLQNMQKCCSQPTKMLLMFIKRKYDNYCDTLMKCLHIAELTDAIEILNRSSDNIGN